MGAQERSHEDLVRTAIHEAGHAVVASRFGRLVSRITIVPDFEIGAWGAVGLFEDERFLDAGEGLAISEPEAAVWELLAGAAAEVVMLDADPSERSGLPPENRTV